MDEATLAPQSASRVEYVESYIVLPTGLPIDRDDAHSFALTVAYRGEFAGKSGGGWAVTQGALQLSRTLKWDFPQPFQRWQFRFETFDKALEAARSVVDLRKVNGRTWAQWSEFFANLDATKHG